MSIKDIGSKCCGCRACLQCCPCNAIRFQPDKYGFEYPTLNAELCVNCNLCETVCPMMNEDVKNSEVFACGAAFATDQQTKYTGSSGGLFGVFAQAVLSEGGIVFGAAFDKNLKLKTTSAETEEELIPLYKSKYLLCDTNQQFRAIEQELQKERFVLYCSSPCQIAALKRYLKKDYSHLLTIDFICHGVGSQTLFDESIAYTEKREEIQIQAVTLRYKKAKASSHYYQYGYLKNGKLRQRSDLYFSFPYYYAYCKQLACRDSCYDCKYASCERVGDITVGDFHTIERYMPKIDRFAGVSMLLINTQKGKKWFDTVASKLEYYPMEKDVLYANNRFSRGSVVPAEQMAFRESIATEPFEMTVKRFLKPSREWKKLIYYKSPRILRKIIMKLR